MERKPKEPSVSDETEKDKPIHEVKTVSAGESLSESELDQVAGGSSFVHHVDKASPRLFVASESAQPTTPPAK